MVTNSPTTATSAAFTDAVTFEERLARDSRWAVSEGSLFFEDKGAVQESLRRITGHLNTLGIPYAVAGGMALFQHGYRRFTEDVVILVTREGLRAIHKALVGRGYVKPFEMSKNLRDTETKVKIEFLLAGDFPGDGKPKAVQFPDPQNVSVERDGIRFLNLAALVELKLASGMTGSDRMKDLADVQELIKLLNLSEDFGQPLSESVRDRYLELWRGVRRRTTRYTRIWTLTRQTADVSSLDDLLEHLQGTAGELEAMRDDGVTLERTGDHACLVTTDPDVARKYGMQDESEIWDDEGADADLE